MPKQDITYKVKIDPTDLYAQLQDVRNQINQVLSAQTFSMLPPSQQPGVAFPLPGMPQLGIFPTPNVVGNLAPPMSAMNAATSMGFGQLENLTNATRLGFQKLNNDVQNLLLSNGSSQFGLVSSSAANTINQMGFFSRIAAAAGFGYNPASSTGPGYYQQFASEGIANSAAQTLITGGFSLLGGTLGAPLGPVGETVGGIVGGGVGGGVNDLIGATIGRTAVESENYRQFIRNTSWRSLGGRIGFNQAGVIGEELSNFSRSNALVGYGIRRPDVERMLQEFTEIGGFEYTRSAEEYEQKAKSLIENTRKIMQTLMVSEKNAIGLMHELDLYGLGNQNLSQFSIGTAAQAYAAGLMPIQLLQFGAQAAEMVRGTGINMGSAFLGGMGALSSVIAAERSGALPIELIQQLGGETEAASNVVRLGYQWGNSLQGFTALTALQATGGNVAAAFANPQTMLGLAVGNVTGGGITGIATAFGKLPEMVSKFSPGLQYDFSTAMIMSQMHMAHMGINKYSFRYIDETQFGESAANADERWAFMQQLFKPETGGPEYEGLLNSVRNSIPTTWNVMTDRMVYGLQNIFNSSLIAKGYHTVDDAVYSALQGMDRTAISAAGLRVSKTGELEKTAAFSDIRRDPTNAIIKGRVHEEYMNTPWYSDRHIMGILAGAEKSMADSMIADNIRTRNEYNSADWLSRPGIYAGWALQKILKTGALGLTGMVEAGLGLLKGVDANLTPESDTVKVAEGLNANYTKWSQDHKMEAQARSGLRDLLIRWGVKPEDAQNFATGDMDSKTTLETAAAVATTNMDKNLNSIIDRKGYMRVMVVNR